MDNIETSRRQFLIGSGLVGASAMLPLHPAFAATDHATLARDAFVWGLPLVLMGRNLENMPNAGIPLNQFFVNANLETPQSKAVGPNIDTLYGNAWIDLSAGPQVIGVPDSDDRYYSIQLQDMYLNSFAYIGRRTTGTKAGAFVLTPPGYKGKVPAGLTEIRATTSQVLAFVRTLLRGPEDLEAARAVHTAYTLGSLADYPNGRKTPLLRSDRAKVFPFVDLSIAGAGYYDELDRLAKAYPPLPWDKANLARFAPIGVGMPGGPSHDPGLQAALAAAVPEGYALVKRSIHLTWANGWARRDNIPAFIHDPLQRAANNFFGKGTHLSAEAVYWGTRQGAVGDWLSGANRYRLRFAAGQTPPVDAFWSLTLYDKGYTLFDNPLNRYGILDRTQGLKYGPDGSLEIQIQADPPAEGTSNWLPAPREEFQLLVRAYQPRKELLDGPYVLPPLVIVP